MDITLSDLEIKKAILDFINNEGISTIGQKVEIQLIAGRGAKGHTATICTSPLHITAKEGAKSDPFSKINSDPDESD